jgi:hypothetical protein
VSGSLVEPCASEFTGGTRVVDMVVLPASRSISALTDAEPLKVRPSRALVMAKGNRPSMSLLRPKPVSSVAPLGWRWHIRGGLS